MTLSAYPPAQGLYDPRNEHDACGVGFIVDLKGRKSHSIVQQAVRILLNLEHRGACGCEKNTGGGSGPLLQRPDRFMRNGGCHKGLGLPPSGSSDVEVPFWPAVRGVREPCSAFFRHVVRD